MVIRTLPNRAELVRFPAIPIVRLGVLRRFQSATKRWGAPVGQRWLSQDYFGLDRGIWIPMIGISFVVDMETDAPVSLRCQEPGVAPSSSTTLTRHILNRNDVLAPDAVDRSVLIVVAVIRVISVTAMIAPVIGHRVSDCRAPDATHDRADRTANNSPGNSAPDRSGDRAAFVGKGDLR
jgi:hypothetical protein